MASASDSGWMSTLPLVMLGVRSSWRKELDASPADLVYGEPLRLPGDFITHSAFDSPSMFATDLQAKMATLRASDSSFHLSPATTPSDAPIARFSGIRWTYVRVDSTKPPLTRPYIGPFEIVAKFDKYFEVRVKNRIENISVDRLKPAYRASPPTERRTFEAINASLLKLANYPSSVQNQFSQAARIPRLQDSTQPLIPETVLSPTSTTPYTTRSGRVSRPVSRFSP